VSEREDTFWRKFVLPQEERMVLGIPYHGGYRWFRSPNVIPIEELRRRRERRERRERGPATPVTPAPRPAA
jgi:hypothetical protein